MIAWWWLVVVILAQIVVNLVDWRLTWLWHSRRRQRASFEAVCADVERELRLMQSERHDSSRLAPSGLGLSQGPPTRFIVVSRRPW